MKRLILWSALILTLGFIVVLGSRYFFNKPGIIIDLNVNKIDEANFNEWFETRFGTQEERVSFFTKVEKNGSSGHIYYYRIENTYNYKIAVESKLVFSIISKYNGWKSFKWLELNSGETKEFSVVVDDVESFPAETHEFIGFVKMDNMLLGFLNRLSHNTTVGISATVFVPAYYVPIR